MPPFSYSFDLLLNNRLWSASQVFLLLWGASKAFGYKTAVLYLSLHSTRRGKSSFPACSSPLCLPVCNALCCSLASKSKVHATTVGGGGGVASGVILQLIYMRGKWTEKNNHKELLYVIFYVQVCILNLWSCKQYAHISSLRGGECVRARGVCVHVCMWRKEEGWGGFVISPQY